MDLVEESKAKDLRKAFFELSFLRNLAKVVIIIRNEKMDDLFVCKYLPLAKEFSNSVQFIESCCAFSSW